MDQPIAVSEPGRQEASKRPLWLLIFGMIMLTLLEWGLYLLRDGLGPMRWALVPTLLVSSLAKMAMVVFGVTRLSVDPGLAIKALFAALIAGGGLALAFVELLT